MIRFLLTILIFFPTGYCFTQEFPNLVSPTKVTTIGYWENGGSVTYRVQESSSSYKGKSEKPFRKSESSYDIRMKVTDSTETSYVFEMLYMNYVPDAELKGFLKELEELQSDVPVIYRTNELGQFDTILNLPALQKELIAKLELSKGLIVEEQEKERVELYKMVVDNMIAKFGDITNVEGLYLSDIIMLHGFYGLEMQQGKPMDIELNYATIGDFILTGTGKLTLNSISKPKDECVFGTTEKPNRDELKEYMESLAMLFMLDSQKKFSMEELNITLNTKKKMKMELSTGWMNSVENTMTMKLTNKKGEQKKVMTKSYSRD